MNGDNCPVCGHPHGACTGPARERPIITAGGIVKGPMRLPIQRTRIGRASYVGQDRGEVRVYDAARPHLTLVAEPADDSGGDDGIGDGAAGTPAVSDETEEQPKKRRKRRDDADDKRLDDEEDKGA